MFIIQLFTIANLWKQPRCPIIDEWDQEMWYINTMEIYTAIRTNDMSLESKWMQLEGLIFSEVARFRKTNATCFL
jgi:hypothetical protein